MFKKRENAKTRKIAISCALAIFAIAIALVAILIANKGEKIKERTIVAGPELARAMTYDQFQDGDEDINGTDYVKFGAFFLRDVNGDGYAEKIKGTCKQIGKEDTLYMELNVLTNGYLENGVITINGNNFYLQTAIPKDSEIKDNVISNNTKQISLNQINNGTQKLLTGIVRAGDYTYDSGRYAAIGNDTTKMSGTNTITLTGTHVAADGTRTQINKTIDLTMDWYGSAKAEIPSYFLATRNLNQLNDNTNVIDEANNRAVFDFELAIQELENNILLSKTCLEGTLPQLNGYDPIGVETGDESQISTYDPATRTFTVSKSAELNDDGTIKKECFDNVYYSSSRGKIRYNKFKIKLIYPLEAYQASGGDTAELRIPIRGYFEGYNNPNAEFTQPYQSAKNNQTLILTYSQPTGDVGKVQIYVGKYIYEPNRRYVVSKRKPLKIYNEMSTEEKDDKYTVRWILTTGKQGTTTGFKVKETANGAAQVSDQFIKADSTSDSAESAVSNVGIAFSNPVNMLGEDGWIKVYDDETGDLIHEFTKSDWTKYTEDTPYRYPYQIKHIRVETSATQPSTGFSVYNIKEIDDEYMTTNYTREEFDNLKYVKSTVVGYVGDSYLNQDKTSATYETPYAYAKTILNKTAISTQETEKDMQIKISAEGDEQSNYEKWKNGTFLVKMPKDIIDVEINSVEVDNKNVTITSYETYEENSERFIKINTTNETPTAYTLTINGHITPDPRIPTTTETVEVYTSNEEAVDYHNATEDIYDINGNQNASEKIGKATVNLSLVSPNSLLTNQVATNYDEAGSIAVAPQSAVVSKEKRSATVNIEINNNYSSTISNVQILGRVPFKGNKYAISNEDMGSTFTTTMTNAGITVPDALKSTATIYYSENGDATNDLSRSSNGWTTTPSDYSKIKSYLVDLGEYKLNKGEKHTISYNINIPEGLNYNQVAYSHHGVYFCLDTEGGKYKTRTEPNKVGFMIAKQYDLELTKYQKNKTNIVSGATYAVYEEGNEEARTRATGIDGKLTLTGLYVDRTYVVKEIKTPDDYELNEEVVKFTTSESNAVLTVTKISGTTKKIRAVQATTDTGYKVQLEVEDEAKVRLKIKKTEKGTTTAVKGIGFKITGTGLPENGKGINTNANGEITLKGLKVGEEYTIEETKATGYYLITNPIKFKVTNNNGTYTATITSGETKSTTVTEEENIPVININLEDEKIPTYNLEITKIKKVTSVTSGEGGSQEEATTYLQGAKFKLYKGEKELGSYFTDANGKITISNLYQYIDGKDEDATYMLKETLAPDGYAKVKDITFKVDGSTGELKFVNTEGKEEKYTVEGTTVKLTIEDSPSFKLIKKDGETGARLAGIKFAIYNVEEGSTPAKNSKGEIIGTKETINGKEYYTVTTDSNGKLTADLPEGMYKAVEVQAPEKYDISEPYYFGIGASREGKTGAEITSAQQIGGTQAEWITSAVSTSDGGYIVGGSFVSSSVNLDGIVLENKSNSTSGRDGMIIKYTSNGEIEWAKSIGGTGDERIASIAEASDGGYIVVGKFDSLKLELENGTTLKNISGNEGMIIKYASNGEMEWAKIVGGNGHDSLDSIETTSDGGYIVGGSFASASVNLGNGVTLTNSSSGSDDGMIIKYTANGDVEWAKSIAGDSSDYVLSVSQTKDGGYILGGETIIGSSGIDDGITIKYSANGDVEWYKVIGGEGNDCVNTVKGTTDGGWIIGGFFGSNDIDLGNDIYLTNRRNREGMLIKCNSSGEIEWVRTVQGALDEEIETVVETKDGGYLIGGIFSSQDVLLTSNIALSSKRLTDWMIIKYDATGEVEWGKEIGGQDYSDYITAVLETNDEKYIACGYILSSKIDLENGISISNKGDADGIIVTFEKKELEEPSIEQAKGFGGTYDECVNTVIGTKDNGYIVGGYFKSRSIDLGNGVILTNKNSSGSFSDGMVIKYNTLGEIEWAHAIGGDKDEEITSIVEANNGGYIVAGNFSSTKIYLDNGISFSNNQNTDGMIIKYSENGEAEWVKTINGTVIEEISSVATTSDGGYIVGGRFYSSDSIDLGNGNTLVGTKSYDGMIIKYNENGEAEWAHAIGGDNFDEITSVIETKDKGYIVGGHFYSSSINLGNGLTLKNNGQCDGILIKYNSEGKIEYTRVIAGVERDEIRSIVATSDGGYLVAGDFWSDSIELDDKTKLIKKLNYDGMLIKYSAEGKVEWAKVIGGSINEHITSVIETSDRGYLVAGYFSSQIVYLENENVLIRKGTNSFDGMLIKYNENGNLEWSTVLGGDYDDEITAIAETSDENYIAVGYFCSESIEFEKNKKITNKGNKDGMILKIKTQKGVPEVQELEVVNNRKEYKITTDINEIDNIKGGTITGENETPYEKVKYGDNSIKEIKMIPDESYEIIGITVNGEEYKYTVNTDGSYTMPTFTNVTEDKHVVVTYSLKDNKITINKVDKDTKEKLAGAKFKLDQIEERSEPNSANIIGTLTDNGQEYTEVYVTSEVTGKLGTLTNNGTYYFVQNSDGILTPTNSKTYQVANGGTAGIHSITANSYVAIDLTGLTGQYAVVINARCSSEGSDYGYATITENTTAPAYNSTTGRFMYISGTKSNLDYTSNVLEGGKTYYLHLGYRKDSSVEVGEDQVVINSINLYRATSVTYDFVNNNGKYESTNQGKDSTVANSYIPIDLTNYAGKYNLTVNAEVSSQKSYDYGYATVTENTTRPSYNSSTGRFVYISGTQTAKDYTTELQGGKMYYLHLGYYKNANRSEGDDKFTVNSISISLSGSELYQVTVETNSDGQAITQIPFGKYNLTEIQAPEGYTLDSTPRVIEFRSTTGATHEFTVENEKKAQVIVHHYAKNTTTKLAEDEQYESTVGAKYTTSPKLDLLPYKLEVDSNGAYVLPANATGTYKTGTTEVDYYYVEGEIPLTVHHYIEGTTEKVPLKAGGTANDVTGSGQTGTKYTTSAIEDDLLSDEYELAETPVNATGTYEESEVVVTYYYKKAKRPVIVAKTDEKGDPLAGAKFTIDGIEYTTDSNGLIEVTLEVGTHEIAEIEAPDGYKITAAPSTETITKQNTSTRVQIANYRQTGTVTVHHYIQGTTNQVPLADGTTAKDETKTGNVGDIYATQAKTNLSAGYELASEPDNSSGTYINGNIDVIYYYKTIPATVTVHHYLEGTTTKLANDDIINGLAGDNYTTSAGNVENKYELVATPANAKGTMTREGIEVIYYYRLKSTSVLVHHYIEGTTTSLSADQTIQGKVDAPYTTSPATNIPSKYELVAPPSNASGTMTVAQIVVTYYYRLKESGVDVHYYIEGTTDKVSEDKTINGKVDTPYTTSPATDVPEQYELIATPSNSTGKMTESRITVIYYYRLKSYPYTVNYLEKGTNTVLHEPKQGGAQVYGTTITASNEKIDIDGYNLDSYDKTTLTIGTGNNVINIYYTKKTNLTYTVNYLESVTNKVLHEPKVQDGTTFETKINAEDEVIDIEGYNYDYPDKYELIIGTGANVINIYYTKVTGLSYTINYLEKGTNKKLFPSDNKGNMTFGDTVTAANEIIDIDGYNYDSVDKDTLTIGMGENIINIYYTKRTDLTYKVNYLEKGTNKVLSKQKVQTGMTFESTVTSADEVIPINGYNYDSVDKDTLTISTGENIINIYYTKKTDLSYKVNYLEKGSNKVIHDQRIIENITFETEIKTEDEIIAIVGYNYDSVDKDTLIIGTGDNIINVYYTKRTDLSYKVNYLEKDTNQVIHNQKVVENMTFEDQVKSSDEIITIYGYNYDSVDKDTLIIGADENIINIYYTKKDAKVTVHYYEENTTNKVSKDQTITGKVNDEYQTAVADDIPSKYELVAKPNNASGTMTEADIEVIYYFRKKATQVIVKHLEEGTTNKLSKDVTIEGRVDDPYTTQPADDVPIKYELSITPDNANGTMTEATTTVTYYYRVKDAVVNVRYLEKNTDIELAPADKLEGKVDQEYQTKAQEVESYQLVECDGNEQGKYTVEPITITYYYLYKTKATVEHIDKITGAFLERKTQEGLEGDDFVTDSINFPNYVLVEEPENKTIKMTKEEKTLRYYYIHISGGVIEKHIDIISGGILGNDTHEGNEGDPYDIKSRSFPGYDLVEDKLPGKAKGTMTIEPITVEYYYIYRTKVTAEYIDKNTGKKIETDEIITGHEEDEYKTTRKIIDDYKLVEVPEKADGKMTKDEITVTYYYVHTSGGVIVDHLDVNTGKQVADQTKQEGYEGDPYETHEENVPGYELVKEKYPDNATGTMKIEETRVTYYYIKKTQINVRYVDMNTQKDIDEPTTIPGLEGDDYQTKAKEIPGYDLIEEPENKEGTMTAEPFDVIYYYKRPAKVITKYIDKDTEEEIAKQTKQEGHENDEYETEAKEIKYYELLETPENSKGTMTVTITKDEETGEEKVEDTTYVNYYYRKLIFNLNIDKKIASITINGNEKQINGDVAKIEINKKELKTAQIEVKYIIKVTNDSELTGKAKILEDIPAGMIMDPNKNNGWEARGTKATKETRELKPGESEEILVVLDWDNRQDNIGTKENTATIIKTENEAGYEEKDETDNQDKADIIVAISTGENTFVSTASGVLLILMAIACGIYIVKKQD